MPDMTDDTIPGWMVDALRAPVDSDPAARARIMDRVRACAPPGPLSMRQVAPRWARRGVLSPMGALLGLLLLAVAATLPHGSRGLAPAVMPPVVRVIGDSVVPLARVALDGSWLDTLRVVDVVVRGAAIRSAAVLGARRDDEVAMREREPGEWHARVLAAADALPVAVVVNDAQLVPVAPLPRSADTL